MEADGVDSGRTQWCVYRTLSHVIVNQADSLHARILLTQTKMAHTLEMRVDDLNLTSRL